MTKRLQNKTAVITGGASGFGFETAKRYIEEGAHVLIADQTKQKVDEAVAKLGKHAYGFVADVSRIEELDKLAKEAKRIFENVAILLANAGCGFFASIADVDEKNFYDEFNLNVKGVFFTVQKILPLLTNGSSVILISSAGNAKGAPMGSLYFASKAAVRSFARSMAAELGEKGIRVNSLSPGIAHTNFFRNSNVGENGYQQFEEIVFKTVPLKRAGTALEIAHAAVYLGSDESSYVTGADLVVDGGWANI